MLSQREITCPHEAVQDWTIKFALRDRSPADIERSSILKPCTTAQALQVDRIVVHPPVATLCGWSRASPHVRSPRPLS